MWTRGKKTQIWATPNFSKFFKQIQLFGPSFHRGSSQARDSLRATAMAIKRFCAAELTHFFLPVCVCTSFFDNNWWFFDNDFWFMIFDLWSCHVFHTWLGLIHQLDFFFTNWIRIQPPSCWPRVHSVRRDVDHYKVIWFCSATSS